MADAGLWIYDTDGTVRFGQGTSNVTILGVVDTGKSNGSITNPLLAKGKPVFGGANPVAGTGYTVPDVTFSGTTMSWSFKVSGANYNQPCRIIYGVRA